MSRSLVLSNGELAIALDERGEVRDIYYPHVGLEDHVRGHYLHRVGVWIEGRMSWFSDDEGWNIHMSTETDALASVITARHAELQVELVFKDIIYNEKPVFVRRISMKNLADRNREIKLYFGHQFEIYKSHGSDTAYFDPVSHSVIHYKGHRVFLIGAMLGRVLPSAVGRVTSSRHVGGPQRQATCFAPHLVYVRSLRTLRAAVRCERPLRWATAQARARGLGFAFVFFGGHTI